MNDIPKSNRYWVITENNLDEVVAQFAADQTDGADTEAFIHAVLLDFFHSPQVINRGMRRGGDTESDHD